jgi:hypothetical protein
LTEEAKAAAEVKRDKPIVVVLGIVLTWLWM